MSSPGAATRDRRGRRLPPQSTYISPTTGERIKRVFSLRDASHRLNDGSHTSERQPLLPRNTPKQDDSWLGKTKQYASTRGAIAWKFAKSSTGQGVLKCSLAYTIASLATFVPAISSLIGKADSKHVVCTVTVYFSPARTIGSMHEAVILALIGFCYAAFISFTSMGVSMFFAQRSASSRTRDRFDRVLRRRNGFHRLDEAALWTSSCQRCVLFGFSGVCFRPRERRYGSGRRVLRRQGRPDLDHGYNGHLCDNYGQPDCASHQSAQTAA